MGFRELEKEFRSQVRPETTTEAVADDTRDSNSVYRYWQLRLLFEIAGNLDSLVVSNRNAEKHIERMSILYAELVNLHKEKAGKK